MRPRSGVVSEERDSALNAFIVRHFRRQLVPIARSHSPAEFAKRVVHASDHPRPHEHFFGPAPHIVRRMSSTTHAALEKIGTPSLFPNAERAANDDELADVIGGVIRHQQNGTQVSLIAFPGRNRRRQIIHIARKRLHLLA